MGRTQVLPIGIFLASVVSAASITLDWGAQEYYSAVEKGVLMWSEWLVGRFPYVFDQPTIPTIPFVLTGIASKGSPAKMCENNFVVHTIGATFV